MRTIVQLLAATACVAAIASDASAGDCNVDGTNYNSSSGTPVATSSNGKFLGDVCGHTVYGPSGSCHLYIDSSDSVTSGDCLTVGKGVTITTASTSVLTCTSNLCGDAINKSGSGSGNTTIDGLHVVGPWLRGIETITTNDTYSNCTIDLSGDCWTLNTGIDGTPNLIDGCEITGGDQIGAGLATWGTSSAGTVKNTVFRNCRKAIRPTIATVIDNVLFWSNDLALDGDSANGDMRGSHFVGNDCDCKVSGVCEPISECMDLDNPPSFIEDSILR